MNYDEFDNFEIYDEYVKLGKDDNRLLNVKASEVGYKIVDLFNEKWKLMETAEQLLSKGLYDNVSQYPFVENFDDTDEDIKKFIDSMDKIVKVFYQMVKSYIELNFVVLLKYPHGDINDKYLIVNNEIIKRFEYIYNNFPNKEVIPEVEDSPYNLEELIYILNNDYAYTSPYEKNKEKKNIITLNFLNGFCILTDFPFRNFMIKKIEYLYNNGKTLEDI